MLCVGDGLMTIVPEASQHSAASDDSVELRRNSCTIVHFAFNTLSPLLRLSFVYLSAGFQLERRRNGGASAQHSRREKNACLL